MNLGIVTPQLRHYGGSEIYLLECLARWQERAGVTVYTPSFDRRLFEEFGIDPRRVEVVPLPAFRKSKSPLGRSSLLHETLVLPRLWERRIRRHDVHFLYLFPTHLIRRKPSVWFAAEPLRMLYDLRHHVPSGDEAVPVHLYPKPDYDLVRASELDVLLHLIETVDSEPHFDRLATNSFATGRYLENIYGRTADIVAYPGIRAPGKLVAPTSPGKALFVGRLWRHKRVDLLLKAAALLPEGRELVIVGDGPERPALQRLARRLGIERRVTFAGDVSVAERERLYRECACCVYTPLREPFGMVPLEAAAAGRPVVATAGGGYGEILTDEAATFVPADETAIARAVEEIVSSPERVLAMGRAGQRVVAPYTWDRTAEELFDFFRETADGPVVPRRRRRHEARPLLGAHYYPWYSAASPVQHWNENREYAVVSDPPSGGPYTSTDPAVVRRHVADAAKAGLDFFVVNWQIGHAGLDPIEVEATEKLVAEADRAGSPLRFAILLAISTEDPATIRRAIEHARDSFTSRKSYLRDPAGTPLLWFFVNDPFLGFLFHHYSDLRRLCRGTRPVAAGGLAYNKFLPRHLREFFSGWSLYSPLEVGSPSRWESIWRESYRDFAEDGGELRVFTICPGYDDSRLESLDRERNRHRAVPRRGLRTYERMQQFALALDPAPDYVVVTSFNEFHENTHIEPSRRHGDRYLRATRAFLERLLRLERRDGRAEVS